MALPDYAVTEDEELERAARDKTSYGDDELPGDHHSGQMEGIINDAKRVMSSKTGSDQWYQDTAFGQAMVSLVAMKMKEAVENVNISSYGIGDETVSFNSDNPETSQQIRSWSAEIDSMLDNSSVNFTNKQDHGLRNTGAFIG